MFKITDAASRPRALSAISARSRHVFCFSFRAGRISRSRVAVAIVLTASAFLTARATVAQTTSPQSNPGSIVRKVENASERMEMIVNTSRILTLSQKIKTVQVNNREVLQPTPLSPNQVQISAKRAGVDQINLWTEDGKIYTIDVIIYGDARELAQVLKAQFPDASLKVTPVANAVRITGFVDQPEYVTQVIQIAQEYYPKVIDSITVSGVQQVLLHVKIMEVSRTKLRELGIDWAKVTGNNIVASGPSGLITSAGVGPTLNGVAGDLALGTGSFGFSIVEGANAFFMLMDALRDDKLVKVLAEPTLVTVSGRPASFNVGGEIPILVPQSLGTTSIQYKRYGTQLDFVPIVMGNGKIRLDVRPKVSEIDPANSVELFGVSVPGLRSREVETGVEMNTGETLAIAGLIQERLESQRTGLPWVSEVPYLGALFRRSKEEVNEIEMLVLVTPELVDPLKPNQVPPCGPGMFTTNPSDCELYFKGMLEVPRCCPTIGACGADGVPCQGGSNGGQMPGIEIQPGPEVIPAGGSGLAPSGTSGMISRSGMPVQTARRLRSNPHNALNRQGPPMGRASGPRKPLPGFKGRVGYEMLR